MECARSFYYFMTHFQAVKDVSTPMPSWPKHIKHSSFRDFSRLFQCHNIFRNFTSTEEYRGRISSRIGRYDFSYLNGVISQEVVEYQFSGIPKHAVCVIPETVESEHMPIMIKKLLQSVKPLVWP